MKNTGFLINCDLNYIIVMFYGVYVATAQYRALQVKCCLSYTVCILCVVILIEHAKILFAKSLGSCKFLILLLLRLQMFVIVDALVSDYWQRSICNT